MANSAASAPPRRRWPGRLLAGLLLLVVGLGLLGGFLGFGPDLWLKAAQAERMRVQAWLDDWPLLVAGAYFILYVAFTGLSLPGALFLTILGGLLFPFPWALLLVSFASTLGATLAFLSARYLLRERLLRSYGDRVPALQRELDRAGGYYLLSMRLNPLIPYVLINLLFGLTALPVWKFWIVSQLGMLPVTCMYLFAGARLARIQSVREIVTPDVVAVLVGLSLLPLATRAAAAWLLRYGSGKRITP